MKQPISFYEIELKAILSKEEYNRLYNELPQNMRLINEETIHTTRYRPGDVRLRHSDKMSEIVCKEGDPTKISRKEVKIPLSSKENIDYFSQIFALLNFQPDPPWTKHKKEFEYKFKGFSYILCLQNIENFAYILEVEFLSEKDEAHIQEPNLRAIIKELGLKPINPKDFLDRMKKYIEENKNKLKN